MAFSTEVPSSMVESCPATSFGPHLVFCQASRAIPGSLPRPRLGVAHQLSARATPIGLPPANASSGHGITHTTVQQTSYAPWTDPICLRSEMRVRAASRDHADAARARRYHVHCTVVPAYFFRITQYTGDTHNARTLIPMKYTHVNPTPRSIFEDYAGKSSRLTNYRESKPGPEVLPGLL
jgi:hypothetical protein